MFIYSVVSNASSYIPEGKKGEVVYDLGPFVNLSDHSPSYH